MNILLTGASGFLGRHIAAALRGAGHTVRPVSRRDGVDLSHRLAPAHWRPLLGDVDAVINSAGIIAPHGAQRFEALHTQAPIALFDACVQAGVRRVLQISALGADATAFSAYHLSKRAADEHLRGLDLDGFVLRPSLVYGPGGASTALFMRLAALPLIPVPGDGQQTLQPVHISDVVATVLQCLQARPARQTLDVLGDETFSFAQWLQRLRQAQGLPPGRLLHLPWPLMLGAAHLGRPISPLLHPDNLRMLRRGYRADPRPLARFLGRAPRAFEPLGLFSAAACGSRP